MPGSTNPLFLGRQPIVDREQRLYAYELLFRSCASENAAAFTDGVAATATVIANAFTELGIEAALGSFRGFINVDQEFLFSDMLELLPSQAVVLEILETVEATPAVIERCRMLKATGFMLALDDFVELRPQHEALLALADIVKIDIQDMPPARLAQLTRELAPYGKTLLAEKVDAREQMTQCLALGFSLFQGYFFARPTIIAGRRLDHSQLSLMKLMGLLLSDADTHAIEQALKSEPALTVNLLRMSNSVAAGGSRIASLNQAITLLGRRQLQRWLQLLLFASGKRHTDNNALLLLAATRGRLMELLAAALQPGNPAYADQAFMVGIMSLMPALVGLPIRDIVAPLPVAPEVRDALCDNTGSLAALLAVAESSEEGDPERLAGQLADLPGLDADAFNQAQTEALAWAATIAHE